MDKIESILSLLKEEDLDNLGKDYAVDNYNTKLLGKLMFKGLLKLILLGRQVSLRMLERIINQGLWIENKVQQVTFSGLSKRLKTLNVDYFKCIYNHLVSVSSDMLNAKEKKNLHRFDSTIISLSGQLLKDGLKLGGKATDKQIKVSIGLKNELPTSIRFCKSQEESSEDIALIRAINESKISSEDILLFDRGVSKANTFKDLNDKDYKFITRVNTSRKHQIISRNQVKNFDGDIKILEDIIVNLYGKGSSSKPIQNNIRLIKIKNKDGNDIWFLTNMFDTAPECIAQIYRRRWDIEVFFKFIKQHLGYKHFLSHSINGMKVYIYIILIAAIMFLIYKIQNKLQGFKIPLFEFTLEIDKSIIRSIVLLAGGNLNLVKHIL